MDEAKIRAIQAPINVIETIIDYQSRLKQGKKATAMFLVRWKAQSQWRPLGTWERYQDLWQFKDKIQKFMQQHCAVVIAISSGDSAMTCHVITPHRRHLTHINARWEAYIRTKLALWEDSRNMESFLGKTLDSCGLVHRKLSGKAF